MALTAGSGLDVSGHLVQAGCRPCDTLCRKEHRVHTVDECLDGILAGNCPEDPRRGSCHSILIGLETQARHAGRETPSEGGARLRVSFVWAARLPCGLDLQRSTAALDRESDRGLRNRQPLAIQKADLRGRRYGFAHCCRLCVAFLDLDLVRDRQGHRRKNCRLSKALGHGRYLLGSECFPEQPLAEAMTGCVREGRARIDIAASRQDVPRDQRVLDGVVEAVEHLNGKGFWKGCLSLRRLTIARLLQDLIRRTRRRAGGEHDRERTLARHRCRHGLR